MSGPTTAILTADPLTVIMAATAIRAAQAIQEAYRDADARREAHAGERASSREAQAAASAAGRQALAERIDQLEARYARLAQLAAPSGQEAALAAARPPRPANADLAALAAHAEQLQALNTALQAALGDLADSAAAPDLGIAAEALPEAEAKPAPVSPTAAVRLLARLAGTAPLPEEIERLASELAAATNAERAELLELELRRAIQRFEENAAREASAIVLEQTLKDLGYQVEPVSDTLFVSGGIVHFRRPGWNDYMVRLRLDATAQTANFNVVRAIDAGNNERSVLDHIAEDRWCSEFPALLKALAARGLHLDVTRRLEAGELPVQLVDREKLPHFADEAEAPAAKAPLSREIR